MNKISIEDLEKIQLFCERHLLPLPLLKAKNNTRYYSSRRKTLVYLLHFENGWSSIKISKILDRNSSTFRLQFPQHEWDLKTDKAYRLRWEELVLLWNTMGVSVSSGCNIANLKPIRLENVKTGEQKYFVSKLKAANFLKCTSALINYYENKGINEFLGYRIINN